MVKRTFGRALPFLHLPVSDRDPETFLFIQLWDGDFQVREFYLGLCDTAAGEPFDFYVAILNEDNEITIFSLIGRNDLMAESL